MKLMVVAIALLATAAASAEESGGIGTPLHLGVDMQGILDVGGVDADCIVRQIQVAADGRVICSKEPPSSRKSCRTTVMIGQVGKEPLYQEPNVLIGEPWHPQVDAQGFIVCSEEGK